MKNLKTIIFVSLLFVFTAFLFLSPNPAIAQSEAQQSFKNALEKCEEGQMNQECWVAQTVAATSGSLNTVMYETSEQDGSTSGLIPMLTNQVAYMIDSPPASSIEYFADIGQRIGIASPAFAQENSTGWRALAPFLEIWKAFRNLSYVFFVFIFIIVGFMIMFRSKIDPQTVITVQSALPRIVVTLLLITFSYAIAGLLIDLIYIIIYGFVGLLQFSGLITSSEEVIQNLLRKNLFEITFSGKKLFARAPAHALDNLVNSLFGDENLVRRGLGWISGKLVGNLGFTFMFFVLFFNIAKIFFSLAKTYVSVVVQIVFSPLVILFNAIPGNDSFKNWIKSLLANILVFPAVGIMFLVAALMMGNRSHVTPGDCDSACNDDSNPWCVSCDVGYYSATENDENVWVPPLFGFFNTSGNSLGNPILSVIGFGMILMITKVPEIVKGAFGVEDKMGGMVAQQIAGSMARPMQVRQSYQQWRRQRRSDALTKAQLSERNRRT